MTTAHIFLRICLYNDEIFSTLLMETEVLAKERLRLPVTELRKLKIFLSSLEHSQKIFFEDFVHYSGNLLIFFGDHSLKIIILKSISPFNIL